MIKPANYIKIHLVLEIPMNFPDPISPKMRRHQIVPRNRQSRTFIAGTHLTARPSNHPTQMPFANSIKRFLPNGAIAAHRKPKVKKVKLPIKSTMTLLSVISTPAAAGGDDPRWWVAPGQTDTYAWVGLVIFFLAILLIVHLYARFDRHVEHRNTGTPLRTTIPTMLTVALAYELMPALSHFSILLPAALIGTAVARDFMLWWRPEHGEFLK